MRARLAAATLLYPVVVSSLHAQTSATIRRLDGSTVSAAAADAFARATFAEHGVTGAQIAVVNGGRLVWSAAYGLRGKNPDLPMTTGTVTWAASITKGVFGAYVMRLVERDSFDLDLPIVRQLPKPLHEYDAYKAKAALLAQDSMWARVTPRMLLSHTAGLRNFASMEPDGQMRLHRVPGAEYNYSGEGINLVQFVIEQRLGRGLDVLMQEALFTPLGMSRTGLVHRAAFESDVADRFGANGEFLQKTRRFPARGAGSMATTAEDLATFAIALMENRVLSAKARAKMLAPAIRITSRHQFAAAKDEGPGEEAKRVGLAYGMGWGLLTRTPYGPAFFKEGHGDGAQTYMLCVERSRSCIIVLTNSDNGELAFRPIMERIFGNTITPWEWEGYTPDYIRAARGNG